MGPDLGNNQDLEEGDLEVEARVEVGKGEMEAKSRVNNREVDRDLVV